MDALVPVEDMVKEVAVAGSKSAVHESHFHHDDS